jgi:hypothetical protein
MSRESGVAEKKRPSSLWQVGIRIYIGKNRQIEPKYTKAAALLSFADAIDSKALTTFDLETKLDNADNQGYAKVNKGFTEFDSLLGKIKPISLKPSHALMVDILANGLPVCAGRSLHSRSGRKNVGTSRSNVHWLQARRQSARRRYFPGSKCMGNSTRLGACRN